MSPTAPNDRIERFRRIVAALQPLTHLVTAITKAAIAITTVVKALTSAIVTCHAFGFW